MYNLPIYILILYILLCSYYIVWWSCVVCGVYSVHYIGTLRLMRKLGFCRWVIIWMYLLYVAATNRIRNDEKCEPVKLCFILENWISSRHSGELIIILQGPSRNFNGYRDEGSCVHFNNNRRVLQLALNISSTVFHTWKLRL